MLHYVISLSVLILAVILIRAIFRKKIPPAVIYAMWLAVVVRMCIPMPLFKMDLPVLFEREVAEVGTVDDGAENEAPSTNHGTVSDGEELPGYVGGGISGVVDPYIPPQGGGTIIDNPTQGGDTPIGNTPNTGDIPSVVYPNTPGEDPVQGDVGGTDIITPPITEITPEAPHEDILPVEPAKPDIVNINVPRILRTVWIAGSAVVAAVMIISALVFQIRARRDRQLYRTIHKTKVYVSENVGGPCLAGLIPAIYLTPENAYSESSTLTMIHEYTHLRHGDYIWSAVRAIALIVHWWNPLVWAAAILSKHDAELAVDAAITKKLNKEKKLEYARIIVDTIPVRGAHAIGLGSGQIKERILMITGSRKNRVIAVILAIAICLGAIGCAFVGRSEGESESESETESGDGTNESDDGPSDFAIEPTEVYELPLKVPEGEVILQAASYGDTFLLGSERITIDGLNGDASVATIRAGADGEGYIVFGCGTYDPQAKPTERRPHFTEYHTYRVVCKDRRIVEVEEVDTITSADVLEYGKPYTGTLDGQYECSRASVFDGLQLYYGILIDKNNIRIKSGAFTSGGSGPKTGTFTYDVTTGAIVADLTYEEYHYVTDTTETINETVSGKLLEYKGMVHFVNDAENASPLPLSFSPDACIKSEGIYARTNEGYDILIIDNKPYKMDGETAFSELNTGDKICVIHSTFGESYLGSPTKTMDGVSAFIVRKIADGDVSDIPREAIEKMSELGLVIMNYGLNLPEDVTRLLSMTAGEIRSEFGGMTLVYSENGPGQPVYKIDGLPGIHTVYHHTNMDDPITDDRYAGEIIVDGRYAGDILGMKIGDDIADVETGITWNLAWYDVINGTVHVKGEFGEYTLEVNMKVADGIGLPDESTATESEWNRWGRSFTKDPKGEISNFRFAKLAEINGDTTGGLVNCVFEIALGKAGSTSVGVNYDETAAKVYFIAPDAWAKNENTMQDNNGPRVVIHDLHDGVIKTDSTSSFGYFYEGDAKFPATITGKTAEGYTYAGHVDETNDSFRRYFISIWIDDLFVHTVELRSYAEYDGDLDAYFERVFRPLLESIRYEFSIGELPMIFSNIYNNAEIAFSRFTDCAMMGYTSEKIEYGGKSYLCVSPGIATSLSDLRKITEIYFTSEIVDKLMKTEVDGFPLYVERDGKLYRLEEYSKQVGRSTVSSLEPIGFYNGEFYVRVSSKAQYLGKEYSIHEICKYKLVEGAIYFTEFPFMTTMMRDAIYSSNGDEGTSGGDSSVSVPVPGGDKYVMEDPMEFLPPEAASRGKSVQVGDSYFISYHTYTEEPSVYVALRLENGNYLMMKTVLPEEDFVRDGFIKDMWDSGNDSVIAVVRRYQIGLACYTDLVCELSLDACNDAHNDQLDAYHNNSDVYKIPAWELVERKFIFDEAAIGAYIPEKAKVVFVKQLLNSPHFLYFCTNEAGTEFMLYHLYANIWGSNPDIGKIERLDVKLPESLKYDTVVPVEYTTGGGSMECKFYLRLTRGSEIFYVSFDNFAWETGEDVLDFEYKGIITEEEQRELAGMYPELFKAPGLTLQMDAGADAVKFYTETVRDALGAKFSYKIFTSPNYLYFCSVGELEDFKVYYVNSAAGGDLVIVEPLDVKLPDYIEYDTVEPVFATWGGGSLECRFYLEITKDEEVSYVEFNNFAWREPEEHIIFDYAGVLPAVEQKRLSDEHPDIFEAPSTIVNVSVEVHGDADCEIIFDEESYESGMFTRFTLRAGEKTVDFEGYQLNYKPADIYISDITGDGVNDYTVVFTWGTGTSVLEREAHVFDGATLYEITVSSPEDYLEENLVQSFDGDKYTLKLGSVDYVILKADLVTPSAHSSDRVGTNSHLTYHVNEDGELVAVIGCMIGMAEYVGVIEIEYGYTSAGELRPAHAKYIDTLSLEYGINSYYDSIRTK